MGRDLERLLAAARQELQSQPQKEEQRRSFAYGNTAFENNLITRQMIDQQAEILSQESAQNDL